LFLKPVAFIAALAVAGFAVLVTGLPSPATGRKFMTGFSPAFDFHSFMNQTRPRQKGA